MEKAAARPSRVLGAAKGFRAEASRGARKVVALELKGLLGQPKGLGKMLETPREARSMAETRSVEQVSICHRVRQVGEAASKEFGSRFNFLFGSELISHNLSSWW